MIFRSVPSLPNWNLGFRDLGQARREMDRLFDSLGGLTGFRTAGVYPAINVSETGEAILVRAELPGVKPEDLDVTVENNTLMLAGKREVESESNDVSYHRREREWGSFRRSFDLPTRVASESVNARYHNGILTIELPKAAEVRPKQIAIHSGS